jgi:nitric oxide reductase NorE protein
MTANVHTADEADPGELPEFLGGAGETKRLVARAHVARRRSGHVPGEPGIWIFILGDVTVFAALLAMLLWTRRHEPSLIAESAARLMPNVGFVNTLVLLSSSYLVVHAIHAHRRDAFGQARRFVVAAIGCAVVFATLKAIEYASEIATGVTPSTNVFFNYYFALTGLHLLHVAVGSALMVWWWNALRRRTAWSSARVLGEGVAAYWHMVDLLWIAIFTLTYLVCPQ